MTQRFLPFIVLDEERMNLKFSRYESHLCHKINSNPLSIFNLIFLIVLDSLLPVNNLDHETDLATRLAVLIVHLKIIVDKKVLRFYVDLSIIQCFQLLDFISVFVLADGLELE